MTYYSYVQEVTAAVTLTTTIEEAVATSPLPDEAVPPAGGVKVSGVLNVVAGAGTTAVVVKVREGAGITGTVLRSWTHTLAAAASANIAFETSDETGPIPIGQYTVTVTQTAATGNGSVTGIITTSPVQQA